MHLYFGQFGQNIWYMFQLWPVVLHVLARTHMAVTTVPGACNIGERTNLATGQQAIWNSNAEHGGKTLNIEAVLQSKRAKLILAQFAAKETVGLVAKLSNTLIDNALVVGVVLIHGVTLA